MIDGYRVVRLRLAAQLNQARHLDDSRVGRETSSTSARRVQDGPVLARAAASARPLVDRFPIQGMSPGMPDQQPNRSRPHLAIEPVQHRAILLPRSDVCTEPSQLKVPRLPNTWRKSDRAGIVRLADTNCAMYPSMEGSRGRAMISQNHVDSSQGWLA